MKKERIRYSNIPTKRGTISFISLENFEDEQELSPEELEIWKKLKTVKARVRWLMQRFPETRNSDLYLTILYLRYFTELGQYIRFIPYELIKKYEGIFETISRTRRKIQESGELLPTDPKVLKRRRKLEKIMRKVIHEV